MVRELRDSIGWGRIGISLMAGRKVVLIVTVAETVRANVEKVMPALKGRIEIIEKEIRSLANEGPTQEELELARKYLIGSYGLNFDTSTKIAGQLVRIQMEDLGIDYMDRRNELVAAVTLEDAVRTAKRLYGEGKLLVSVVGQPVGM